MPQTASSSPNVKTSPRGLHGLPVRVWPSQRGASCPYTSHTAPRYAHTASGSGRSYSPRTPGRTWPEWPSCATNVGIAVSSDIRPHDRPVDHRKRGEPLRRRSVTLTALVMPASGADPKATYQNAWKGDRSEDEVSRGCTQKTRTENGGGGYRRCCRGRGTRRARPEWDGEDQPVG